MNHDIAIAYFASQLHLPPQYRDSDFFDEYAAGLLCDAHNSLPSKMLQAIRAAFLEASASDPSVGFYAKDDLLSATAGATTDVLFRRALSGVAQAAECARESLSCAKRYPPLDSIIPPPTEEELQRLIAPLQEKRGSRRPTRPSARKKRRHD